jgi:hypothetical protein
MPLTDIPNVGRICAFQDSQGAAISIITYVVVAHLLPALPDIGARPNETI